ncbi:ribonuclease T2 [Tunturiibacter gelidiferens]|uniref:Ribonuclease T2 n=1 Tax=Tunturiibacter gelidiferens TaxID=3069689 RepID=A0AAU7Z668_9BACT
MKKKAALSLLILLLLTACNPPPRPTPEPAPRPGAVAAQAIEPITTQPFDFYLLNLSWSPEFCHSHPTATECAQRPAFVLHGLWPQNTNGGYPQNCSTDPGPRDPSSYSDIYPDPGLLRHEWRTHGTCSGLSPDAFFTLARIAYKAVAVPPTLAQLNHQISLTPAQLIDLFQTANPSIPAASLAISCGNNYLTAVEVCLDKRAQPTPCGPVRSCRANSVRITPP